MKYVMIICCILPAMAFAQKQSDYEHAMSRFMKYYNNSQPDSIINMWPENYRKGMGFMWSAKNVASDHQKYGDLKSFKYVGVDNTDPDKVVVFKTEFSKGGSKTTSLTLDKNNYLNTFRFITTSDGINKMVKEEKEEE